jgi:putative ABC transport system permease protein
MTGDIPKNYRLIKDELLASGTAKSVTKTNSPLTERWSDGGGQSWEGKDPNDNTSFDRYLADEGLGLPQACNLYKAVISTWKNFLPIQQG